MAEPEGAPSPPASPDSTYVIPNKSSSTRYDDHDYYNKDLTMSYLSLDNTQQQRRQDHALVDDLGSPTSIYTTESEMPFDEKVSYEEEKDQERSKKKQNKMIARMLEHIQCMPPPSFSSNTSSETSSDHDHNNSTAGMSLTAAVTTRSPVCSWWTWFTESLLHASIKRTVVWLATRAARYPYATITSMSLLSLFLLAIGFFTNFELIVDSDQIYTPMNSLPTQHHDWLIHPQSDGGSGFNNIRPVVMIVHDEGQNVLGKDSLERLFEAVDAVRSTPGYQELCEEGSFVSYDNQHTCRILSATRFWNHNLTLFREQVKTDEDAVNIMSQDYYADGKTPVFHEMMLGNYQRTNQTVEYNATTNELTYLEHNTSRLSSVQSLFARMELPDSGEEADDFETRALDSLHELQQMWQKQDTAGEKNNKQHLQLDFLSIFAYRIENQRALIRDLPLVMGIFLVLVIVTTLVFTKRHPVYSRSMLGCASLLAIGMSLCLSYGIVWCIGIPFTNIAQILPFIIMGVGLDDTFIITGAYFRTDSNLTVERRIETTMNEVGLSISLTSITTMVAFVLGSLSTIPGVKWLCWYAFAAIACDFFFQITFFVALLTLDERRLQAYRKSWCCWKRVPVDVDECESQMGVNLSSSMSNSGVDSLDDLEDNSVTVVSFRNSSTAVPDDNNSHNNHSKHFTERLMIWYGRKLMRPWCKVLVLMAFTAYFGFCCWRTTFLTQEFNVEDYTPSDSYLRGTLNSLDEYYSLTKPIEVYFRNVNQSDPEIQQQMREYVDELAGLPQIGEDAPFCWVRDFVQMVDEFPEYAFLQNFTFSQQLRAALTNPTVREIYGEDIVLDDETGEITASRCLLFLRNVDLTNVNDQIDTLMGQREVTFRQPINQDQKGLNFFSFDTIFFYWELYTQAVDELIFTILSGVVVVTLVTFVLIPHWSAALFVCPGIVVMYLNFLGTMQWMGLHINSLTYVIIVMAIGLLVDFIVHILLRYYETEGVTREEKVKETLRTMGASMFIGGLTTFLSVFPLVLSSTHIFMTVFWAFLAIVVLGFTHGLILLPVMLSLIGPVATHQKKAVEVIGFPNDLGTKRETNTSTSPASSTASKFDLEILESSSEEELEDLKSDVLRDPSTEHRPVLFLGPSHELDIIEEGPDSNRNRPGSTTSAQSHRSIVQAPSDEKTCASPRELAQQTPKALSSLLGQLNNCGADFDFYNVMQSCERHATGSI